MGDFLLIENREGNSRKFYRRDIENIEQHIKQLLVQDTLSRNEYFFIFNFIFCHDLVLASTVTAC